MKKFVTRSTLVTVCLLLLMSANHSVYAQMMRLPDGNTNYKSKTGRQLGATNIDISWNAPGVKGREGKIWGTDIAWFALEGWCR
jgi:hypothetical protein